MIKVSKMLMCAVLMVFFVAGNAMALQLGTNITIGDGMGSGSGWHGTQEDDEVEPYCAIGQKWDLEGFFLKGSTLTMVGGYDFVEGEVGSGHTFKSGDIFIDDIDIDNSWSEYDYVLDMDFDTAKYNVYSIVDSAMLLNVYYGVNEGSNPWRYDEGGIALGGYQGLSFGYESCLPDSYVDNLSGGNHNAVIVDLGFLDPGVEFIAHFTMECGNDNLMGKGITPVPEPATMLLLGTGLIGLAGLGRKNIFQKM